MSGALTLRYEGGGIHLPALGLWLDSATRQVGPERVFVSHAHADHVRAHREVILTEITARCVRTRSPVRWQEHWLDFAKPVSFTHQGVCFQLTLLPAGHILGSAMALIEARGQSLLYTGDFKLRPTAMAEPCTPCQADILIMETTFGRPCYQFPPTQRTLWEMAEFCQQALAAEQTPVLLAYTLGKSQELLAGLQHLETPIVLHEQAFKLTKVYAHFGRRFPPFQRFDALPAPGKVVIWPPMGPRPSSLSGVGRVRTAIVTGWALDSGATYRYRTDAAFPLSDHADFPELIELVKRVAPRKVYTLHGFAADFAQSLRELGFDAQALSESEQLSLPLGA